ncbi:unnamed protein product [Calicophoron daubneyi]|uniref:CRAL-TRIO domain-containing protein n=1 Tax=Calicophoron daubneyi TaxID=300641 RepID=A0AAV2TQE4_CALDB
MAKSPADLLSPFYRDLAKKQVGENPAHLVAHLTSFKRWLSTSPHLKVPDNDIFLMSFLRYAHYDHSLAQKRLDNFCTLRVSREHETSNWYNYPPLDSPLVERYLNSGMFIPLGFISTGSYVVLVRLSAWTDKSITQTDMRTLNNMNFERLLLDQQVQIGGFILFIDMSNTSMEQASQWADMKSAKGSFKLMQEASPGRTKQLIFYKEAKIFDFAFKLLELWTSEKMLSRVLRVKNEIEKAYTKFPELREVMPKEYSGHNGTIRDCIEKCRQEFTTFYANGYPLDGIKVDESKRPASAKNYIKEYKDFKGEVMGISGTYVKIDPGD